MKIVHRGKTPERFAAVGNDIARDERLSYRSLGIYVWLCSHKTGFPLNVEGITKKQSREGRDAVRTSLNELESVGLIKRTQHRDPKTGTFFTVCEVFTAYGLPGDGSTASGSPDDGSANAGESVELRRLVPKKTRERKRRSRKVVRRKARSGDHEKYFKFLDSCEDYSSPKKLRQHFSELDVSSSVEIYDQWRKK